MNGGKNQQQRVKQQQETKYKELVRDIRASTCNQFNNENIAYNCVTYLLSNECFHIHIGSEGMEIGEDNFKKHDNFYNCVKK